MPPVWGQKAPYGSLGTFYGTDQINVVLTAIVSNHHNIGVTAIFLILDWHLRVSRCEVHVPKLFVTKKTH